MLERFHNFSMACALILASGCLGSLVGSLQRSKEGRVPVYQVVLHELPILAYLWILAGFLADPNHQPHLYLAMVVYLSTGAVALYRFFSYTRKRENFEVRSLSDGIQQTMREVVHLQVMSQMEQEKYFGTQTTQTNRRSRYSREPVI